MYLTMDVCRDQQTISQDWSTEDVFINQQEISQDWPTEDVYIDHQEISEEWPTKESFKRREISKWRDISDDIYKIWEFSYFNFKKKMEMNFLYGPLNVLLKI